MRLHRPDPILHPNAAPIEASATPDQVAERLLAGEQLWLRDHYRAGLKVLTALQGLRPAPPESAPFAARQAHAQAQREAASRLLVKIQGHAVALEGASGGGFLRELYPELDRFALPFPVLQELHGAWRRYTEGVHYAVLGHALHPYYGTYAPRRTEHLELFATWLSRWSGPRSRAIDVGSGCGILSLLLARAGFEAVLATDINPNAVESLQRDLGRLKPRPPVSVRQGDLLEGIEASADLIAFNPPWLPGPGEGLLAQALQAEAGLLARFFEDASSRLAPGGRIALVLSDAARLLRPDLPDPIERALAQGRWLEVERLRRRVQPSQKGRRTKERVELRVLARAEEG